MTEATREEPAPEPSDGTHVWPDLIETFADTRIDASPRTTARLIVDMQARNAMGVERYGTPLQTRNGRRPLVDAYQEALDLCVYLHQATLEATGPVAADLIELRWAAVKLTVELCDLMPPGKEEEGSPFKID